MLVVGFAALGTACVAGIGFFFWLNVVDRRPPPGSALVASQAPQPQQAPAQNQEAGPTSNPVPAGAETPTTSPDQQTSEDARQYDIKISYYEKVADMNNSYLKSNMENYRQAAMNGLSKPIEDTKITLKETNHFINMARCLKDQKARGAAFYQGKATCEAAFPGS
jgi:hypothetical protein